MYSCMYDIFCGIAGTEFDAMETKSRISFGVVVIAVASFVGLVLLSAVVTYLIKRMKRKKMNLKYITTTVKMCEVFD